MSAALVVTAVIAAQFSVHPVDGRAVHLSRRDGIRVEMALGPALDPDAAAYIAAVEAADGQALEDDVKDAIYDFVLGCKADGIWDAIKSSAILAGARTLTGALTPLVGTAPTNFNFVPGDYNRKTGLMGDGSTKYLSSNRANNADPQDDNHNSIYVTVAPTAGLRFFMGSDAGGTTGSNNFLQNTDNRLYVRNRSATYNNTLVSAFTLGFKGFSRSSSANYTLRDDGTNSVITRVSEVPSASIVQIFDRGPTPPHSPSDARISFYSIGESIDLDLLDARVSQLMADIDAAIDSLYAAAGSDPVLDLKIAENGDFTDAISGDDLVTFSRSAASSPGTYVGSDGLIKTAAANLLLYSEDFGAVSWLKSAGTSVTVNDDTAPDGSLTADLVNIASSIGSGDGDIQQVLSSFLADGTACSFSFWAKSVSGLGTQNLYAKMGRNGTTSSYPFSINESWQRITISDPGNTIGATKAIFGIAAGLTSGASASFHIWGAQLEESSVVSPYIPTTSQTLAAARFDHDPATLESLGLLVEEQRTNSWLDSGDPDSSSWNLFGVTRRATPAIQAPDGSSVSTVFDFSSAAGRAVYQAVAQTSVDSTVSVYMRTESGTETMYLTLASGGVDTYSAPFTVTDEWQRFSFSAFTSGLNVAIRNGPSGGAKTVYIWGVQYEVGSSPTSYIPTTSAAMTRAADIATIEGADFASWYNATTGTGYGEFDRKNPGSSPVQVLFHFAGAVGRFALYEHQPALAASGFYNLGVSACPVGTFCKHSGAFNGGGSGTESSAFDGVVVVGEAGTVNPDVNKLYIGSRPTGQQLNGHIKRLTYWNTRLPDANLGAITQ